jgi:hypothetical protein
MEVCSMKKRWCSVWSVMMLVVWIFVVPKAAHAQFGAASVEELTSRATIVAVGRVTSLQSEWTNGRTRIVTKVTLTVDQYLKGGRPDRTLIITIPGGEVDGVGELYTHVARFSRREEVVVFAESDVAGGLRVTGGEQGKFTVSTEPATGKRVVAENQLLEVLTSRIQSAVRAEQ